MEDMRLEGKCGTQPAFAQETPKILFAFPPRIFASSSGLSPKPRMLSFIFSKLPMRCG